LEDSGISDGFSSSEHITLSLFLVSEPGWVVEPAAK